MSKRLQLPYTTELDKDPNICYLQFNQDRLELLFFEAERPFRLFAEFLKGSLGYRAKKASQKNENLLRAIGLKTYGLPLKVWDLSAGLGKDAFILATKDCKVTLVERSNIMLALLENGLARARQDAKVARIIERNMTLISGDAKTVLVDLASLEPHAVPDVLYFDPMFPERKKSALTKMELRIIRDIVGVDEDAEQVMNLALKTQAKRLVIKRPKLAGFLGDRVPDFSVKGSSLRYDIYLMKKQKK